MTPERAIQILDPDHREHYESIEPVEEACRIGIKAIKRVKELEAENADLRARLDKAVELPCKIGDEVYEVHGKCDGKNCPYNGDYGQWRCSYGGKRNCNSFITVNKFCYSDIPRVGKTIFVTKKAAEARLAELEEKVNEETDKS